MNDLQNLLEGARKQLERVPEASEAWRISDTALERWAANPAAVGEREHTQLCLSGVVIGEGEETSLPCPVCGYHKAFARLRLMMENCGIGSRYLDVGWDDLDTSLEPFPQVKRACERIELMFERGASLLLHGDHGGGKTQCAMLLARAALERGKSVRVVNLGELSMNIRAGYGARGDVLTEPQAVAMLCEPDLLILEDLGAGEADSGATEKRLLWVAANIRHNARKSQVVTTNLTPTEFGRTVGRRIYDRLLPLRALAFTHGKNFRTPQGGSEWF